MTGVIMAHTSRRAPLSSGRRFPVTITVTAETDEGLMLIGNGNRSAAIELLVRRALAKRRRAAARTEAQAPPTP